MLVSLDATFQEEVQSIVPTMHVCIDLSGVVLCVLCACVVLLQLCVQCTGAVCCSLAAQELAVILKASDPSTQHIRDRFNSAVSNLIQYTRSGLLSLPPRQTLLDSLNECAWRQESGVYISAMFLRCPAAALCLIYPGVFAMPNQTITVAKRLRSHTRRNVFLFFMCLWLKRLL